MLDLCLALAGVSSTWVIVLSALGAVVLVFFGYLYLSAERDRRRLQRRMQAQRADEASRKPL